MSDTLERCPRCKCTTWHKDGVCEWSDGHSDASLRRGADYPSAIDLVCALCATQVSSLEQSDEICRDMDADQKTCPHCFRTYGEARREEGLLWTQG